MVWCTTGVNNRRSHICRIYLNRSDTAGKFVTSVNDASGKLVTTLVINNEDFAQLKMNIQYLSI